MCGICGIIGKDDAVRQENLERMCRAMAHRGPDGQHIYQTRKNGLSAGLGHRRLSIIDLSQNARQPMSNEDGTVWLVFNGEIYNYQALRAQLLERGHKFKSCSDSEVLVHLYEDRQEDCAALLRGMFSFALWDERRQTLFFARDKLGKKPFLYSYDGKNFWFASEFCALLAGGRIKQEINYPAVDDYLTFGYVPAPATIYKDVFKVLPAHYGLLKNGRLTFKKYWELDYTRKVNISEEEAASELIRILKEAVRLRLISDVPVGAFLSGGIDSSTVVALMSQLSGNVKTFSIGTEDAYFNELQYARQVAERYATDHREFIVRPNVMEVLPLLVEHYGEPYADSSSIPSYYVSRETKKFVTVALNGDGGDESFAGYERYQAMQIAEIYHRFPGFLREGIKKGVMLFLPDAIDFKNKRRRLRRFLEGVSAPFYTRYCRWVSMLNEQQKEAIYNKEFKQQFAGRNPSDWLRAYSNLPEGMDVVDKLLAIDIKTNLANDLLVKMDIASMANSLETRSPFLDEQVMQFAASLPANFKLRGMVKKYILKESIKELLPPDTVYRAKMGFGVPIGRWMREELKDFGREILLSAKALKRGYFDPEGLKTYVNEHLQGRKDYTYGIWTLLVFELWHHRFVD